MPEIEEVEVAEDDKVIAYCDGCATQFMLPRTLVKRMANVEDKRIRCEICGNHQLSLNVRKESELPSVDGKHVWKATAAETNPHGSYQAGDVVEAYK